MLLLFTWSYFHLDFFLLASPVLRVKVEIVITFPFALSIKHLSLSLSLSLSPSRLYKDAKAKHLKNDAVGRTKEELKGE